MDASKSKLTNIKNVWNVFGPLGSRLYLKEWKQALLLFLAYLMLIVLFVFVHIGFAFIIFAILFYEWVTSKSRVEKYNVTFEKKLISKWGIDAVSK